MDEVRKGKPRKWILGVAVCLFALVMRFMVLPAAVTRIDELLDPPSFEQIQEQVRSGAAVSYRPVGGGFLDLLSWIPGLVIGFESLC